MGSILSRKGKIEIIPPGGCEIGLRPIDFHLKGLEMLGYDVKNGKTIKIDKTEEKAAVITFPNVSIGATINLMFASCLGNKKTIINNPALEPETICVVDMLMKMGANIKIENGRLIIQGVKKLKGTSFKIICDRIETGSYIFLVGSIPSSRVIIHNVDISHLELVIIVARKLGIKITKKENSLIVEGAEKINRTDILIGPYPFFPTDLQQILTVVLTKAEGTSKIEDQIFPDRITHLKELRKMHAYVYDYHNAIYIKKSKLHRGKVQATDLRCAFALIMAGAMANGTTYIKDIEYLFRGYEKPVEKLKGIGLNVEII